MTSQLISVNYSKPALFEHPPNICITNQRIEFSLKKKGYMSQCEGVVSKETVVLRRWGSSIQKFGFINGVDNVNWPPYRDSKS